MIKYFLISCLALAGRQALAQTADTTQNKGTSPLKAMSYEQYKAYTTGVDINNMGLVAEANHYPDPQKVIGFKKELSLTATQISQITALNTELLRKMKEMGQFIIKNEKALDELFRTKKLNDGTLIFYTNRYGLYQGELRNTILQAYIKTQDLLTPVQRNKYEQLHKVQH